MFKIKKLDLYVLKNFITVLFATFFICLFILLMQFFWKYVDEMIGKGLGMGILAEFFFYSALTLVPLALPLAILLASLMAFGNMGERLELLAMKAAGISLFRIIRPLVIIIVFISIGAFFFANKVIPFSQIRLWTLIHSIRDTSPVIDIPENVFYSGIAGHSILVRSRDTRTNLMREVKIYDFSQGFENITVTVADSARLQFTDDNNFLVLTLYNGESFENLQNAGITHAHIPSRRETFSMRQTIIEFDGNFERLSDSFMRTRHVGKNIRQLTHDVDSFTTVIDSLSLLLKQQLLREHTELAENESEIIETEFADTLKRNKASPHIDALFASLTVEEKRTAVRRAQSKTNALQSEITFRRMEIERNAELKRRHAIQWHRMFTLSFACFIFFFIGAPLGAIIGKGGLGVPVVISIILFIVYYVIDNSGYKFAREGVWSAFQGMWLSASVLLPLGIFLTYKAATDSVIFDPNAYTKSIKNVLKKIKK